jgi:hypothetical protein
MTDFDPLSPEIRAAFDKACAMDCVKLERVEDFDSGNRREFIFIVQGIGPRNIGVVGVKRRENQSLSDPAIAEVAGKHAGAWATWKISEQRSE